MANPTNISDVKPKTGTPCPFCGHWESLVADIVFNDQSIIEDEESPLMMFFIRCTRCNAAGPYEHTKEDAKRSWDNRVEVISNEFGTKIYR